ncbi:MAG: hypothetical protein DRJ49_06970 [Thermoprotei archaeon]|nr:MAG: hypothetical protein DRJ49_06970 [Thermoprotei archaeon]
MKKFFHRRDCMGIEIRRDPINPRIISIISLTRAWRPKQYKFARVEIDTKKCPFCPGNELMTPPSTLLLKRINGKLIYERDKNEHRVKNWIVRIVPNKYPIVSPKSTYSEGYGYHEVVIETREHDTKLEDLTLDHLTLVFKTTFRRIREIAEDEKIKHILWFRNRGILGGASIIHPHSQIIALGFIPPLIREEVEYFREKSEKCLYCKPENIDSERLVYKSKYFYTVTSYAPRVPFELKIIPRFHTPNPWSMEDMLIRDFCKTLKIVLKSLFTTIKIEDYNMWIHSVLNRTQVDFHWHLEILPLTSTWAGVEKGLSVYVVSISPEEAARILKACVHSLLSS